MATNSPFRPACPNRADLLAKTSIKVISLSQSLERRRSFVANTDTDLTWSFFDAHETLDSALSYDPTDAILAVGAPLSPGELGCYSSHYTAWREFLASTDIQLVVLEDDIIIDWQYLQFLISHDFEGMGIDYLRLYAKRPSPFRRIRTQFLEFSHDLIQFTGKPWGTQGYLLTRAGANRFVQYLRCVKRNLDSQMDRSWAHGVANLAVFPFPLFEVLGPSSIGDGRFERERLPLSWELRRLPYQTMEKLLRLVRHQYFRPFRPKA
jgi:glycosyl transferase family 25